MPTQDEMNDEAQIGYIAQKIFIRHCYRSSTAEAAAEVSFKVAEIFMAARKARWEELNGRK